MSYFYPYVLLEIEGFIVNHTISKNETINRRNLTEPEAPITVKFEIKKNDLIYKLVSCKVACSP